MPLNSLINVSVKLSQKITLNKVNFLRLNYKSFQTSSIILINSTHTHESNTENTNLSKFRTKLLQGPNLKDFFKDENLKNQENLREEDVVPYLRDINFYGKQRKVYFDIYGCQMNVNDTEIIWSILEKHKYQKTSDLNEADIVLIVTCAIREGAESKIWSRLDYLRGLNQSRSKNRPQFKIGILGCMAERLKHKVLEKDKSVDLVAGPDSYRDLPRLLSLTDNDQKSVNVLLSLDETYADIMPVRLNENAISAFVSIMRGCDNMCTYCIVPFTRGRERSRPLASILAEVEHLSAQGVKEVTLLGQNVNSYRDASSSPSAPSPTRLARGFRTVYRTKVGGHRFADLLDRVAAIDPEMRIRFTSPHPKDFPDDVLHVIASKPNICCSLHLPAQSGNSQVLERMRRGYTREAYLDLVQHIRGILPNVGLSSDFIAGFCGETETEFADTISLMEAVRYNTAYLFAYSMREKTTAHRRFADDVGADVKQTRLERMIKVFRYYAERNNQAQIGKVQLILIEGFSKRSRAQLAGRNEQNIKVIVPAKGEIPEISGLNGKELQVGDYVAVQINAANSQVLKGIPLYHTKLSDFYARTRNDYEMSDYYYSLM